MPESILSEELTAFPDENGAEEAKYAGRKLHTRIQKGLLLTPGRFARKDEAIPDLYYYIGADGRTYQGYMPGGQLVFFDYKIILTEA